MTGLDDLNQKVIIVVVFTTVLLLFWWFVKSRFGGQSQLAGQNRIKHLETRRLAHASVLSLFEVQGKTILIVQGKQGASFLEIEGEMKGEVRDEPSL